MAKTKKMVAIIGHVILRGRSVDSESTNVGLSFSPVDDQDIHLEVVVPPSVADNLKVDSIYIAELQKGLTDGVGFEVKNLITVPGINYSERMVIKSAGNVGMSGHLSLCIKDDQKDFFYEEDQFSLTLKEVEQEA